MGDLPQYFKFVRWMLSSSLKYVVLNLGAYYYLQCLRHERFLRFYLDFSGYRPIPLKGKLKKNKTLDFLGPKVL